jgi:hypothetical protein
MFRLLLSHYQAFQKNRSNVPMYQCTRPTALLPPRSCGKPETTAAAVDKLLMMGRRMPEIC